MATARYSGYTDSFVYAGPTTLNLKQISGHTITAGRQLTEVLAAGSVDRVAIIESHADPSVRLTSADLTAIFGVISPTVGLSCTGGATFRLQSRLDGGVYDTASTHVTITSGNGFLCPDSISASQDDVKGAQCELMYSPLWGGSLSTPPLVYTGSVAAFSSIDPAFNSQFYLGPVVLNSTQLEGLRSSTVRFGIEYRPKRADGDPYARIGAIYVRRPEIILNFEKASNLATTGIFSNALSASLKVYFWKGSAGGVRTATATTAHCLVTAAAGSWGMDDLSFQEEEDQSLTVRVVPTTALTISVASALP